MMRKLYTYSGLVVILLFVYSCLPTGNNINPIGDDVRVTLDSVIDDSRCPIGLMCVWSGEATVKLKYTDSTSTHYIYATLFDKADTLFNGYRIHVENLQPYPQAGIEINQDDYTLDITVSR